MSKARELAVVVANARRDILNRETIRQCRMIYAAIMEQTEKGAKLGCYSVNGRVELDLSEKYDTVTILNQLQLKLELEDFEDVSVSTDNSGGTLSLVFYFSIPEVEIPQPQEVNLGF
jgi:hypothetical protein